MLPVLYSFRRCPYAIRARLALQVAGIAVDCCEVSLRDKPVALRELSPKASVPVLQLPDGRVLEQSLDIMHWALRARDPEGWLAAADPIDAAAWIARNDDEFKPLLDRYKYAVRNPERSRAQHRESALAGFVLALEERLRESRHLLGAGCSVADAAIFPFVRQFAAVEPAWFEAMPLPGIQAWLGNWLRSAVYIAVMRKA